MDRFALRLIALRWWLLAVAAVLTAVALPGALRLSFDRSISNMFAPDDPLLPAYQRLKRTFGGDEIVLAAYRDPQVLTSAGLTRLAQLTAELAEVDGVESTFSIASLPAPARLAVTMGLGERFLTLAEGFTISADRQTVGVACVLAPEAKDHQRRTATIETLRRLITAHDATGVVAGESVLVVDAFGLLENDGRRLGLIATVLLLAVIGVSFASVRWMLVPFVVVGSTLVWTRGLLDAIGFRLSMVSSMLWAIVTVIATATVVHVVVQFRAQRAAGRAPREALAKTITWVAAPVFWACLTDAAGFGSLLVARVGPVRDFGLMMVIGSLATLLSIVLVVPALALVGQSDRPHRRGWGEQRLDMGLYHLVRLIDHHPRLVAMLAIVPTLVAAWGMVWLEVETDFTKNFRADSEVVQSYEFVEANLGGAGVWDVLIPLPADANAEFFTRLRHLQQRLTREAVVVNAAGEAEPGLTKTLGLLDLTDTATGGGKLDLRGFDNLLTLLRPTTPLLNSLEGRDPAEDNRRWLRVMLRSRERQPSDSKEQLIRQVRGMVAEEFPEGEVTGIFVLLARLIDSVSRDQWVTFGLAAAGIGLMMALALRSTKLALVALVPNALPILVVTGVMGWLDLKINMGAAMIASVSMGLAVDSSIHYLTAYLRRRAAGMSVGEAIDAAHQTVGRAMICSTLALVAGFSSLAWSEFVPTNYFGILVSLAMLGGLSGNLILLPLLLRLTERHK